jgi:hypothetical protein
MCPRAITRNIAPPRRSSRGSAGVLVAFSLLLAGSAGCGELLGIDVPPLRATPGLGNEGGEGGAEAGTGGDGASGGTAGFGASGRGQAGRGGSDAGGHGGKASGPSAGGSAGADAGRGGFGPPRDGDPCEPEGALACVRNAGTARLRCEAGRWIPHRDCKDGQYCDARSGACGDPHFACEGDAHEGDRVCTGALNSDIYICGPDLLTAEVEHCVFGCKVEESTCLEAEGDELQLEAPPEVVTVDAYWPAPARGDTRIPVCVTNSEEDASSFETQLGYVKDEIERTWGRYGGVAFTGWGACDEGAKGVHLRIVGQSEPCTNRLGGIDRIGYPGEKGTVNVELCMRYYDADGARRNTSEELLRLVARHEFGHVLGFDDLTTRLDGSEFMARAIYSAQLAVYTFASQHIWRLQAAYGRKPSGALADMNGRCLTKGNGDALTFDACDGSEAQQFRFVDGQLQHEGTATCLRADPSDGTVSFVGCAPPGSTPDPEQAWRPARVQLLGYGGSCLGRTFGEIDFDQIQTDVCHAGYADQAWDIDFVDGGRRLRLRESAGSRCLSMVDQPTDDPTCDSCAETAPDCLTADRLEYTSAGQIATEGRCLAMSGGDDPDSAPVSGFNTPAVATCSLHPRMLWSLSGSIVDGTNRVLTRAEDSDGALLARPPSGSDFSQAETFDYYLRAK